MKPRTLGLLFGLLMAAFAWAGNQERADTLTVSTFPDLLTIFAVPLSIYLALRWLDRRQPGQDVGRLRRAGWSVVNAQAAVFALGIVILAADRTAGDPAMTTTAFLEALFVTAGVGYLSVEIWARLIVRVRAA